MRHLQELQVLDVFACPFISKEALLEVQNDLNLHRLNGEVLFKAEDTKPIRKSGAALADRLQELAPYDERYKYSSDELLSARYSESVPQLTSNGLLALELLELDILST